MTETDLAISKGSLNVLSLTCTDDAVGTIAELVESFCYPEPISVTVTRVESSTDWRVDANFATPPDEQALQSLLADTGFETPFKVSILPDVDWVQKSNDAMPPIRTQRFFVAGPHIHSPPDLIPLKRLTIEAGLAFGTGHHFSTHGCLLAMEHLAKSTTPRNILDVGTGTGLLALAARHLWRSAHITATDIDPVATRIARENERHNQMSGTRFITCAGFQSPNIAARGPYDLIIANILAPPLIKMAQDFGAALVPGGIGILAGLLTAQAPRVLSAYRAGGLRLISNHHHGEWSTLVIERPATNVED